MSVIIGGCTAEPTPVVNVDALADRVERDFEAFCLSADGDLERAASAATARNWWEAPSQADFRAFEERQPDGLGGEGMLFLSPDVDGKASCNLSHSGPRAVAALLSKRLADRYGGEAKEPNGDTEPCVTYVHEGRGYKACHNIYPDAPETASLEVEWPALVRKGNE